MPQIIDIPGHGPTEFPDGMTDDQIVAAIRANPAPEGGNVPRGTGAVQQTDSPLAGMSGTNMVMAGAGRGITNTARGMRQGYALAADALTNDQPLSVNQPGRPNSAPSMPRSAAMQQEISQARQLDAPLMGTMQGKVGNVLGTAAALAPTALVPGANTLSGAALIGGASGFAGTPGTLKERAESGAMGAAGGVGGLLLGRGLAAGGRALMGRSQAASGAEAAGNAVRDATLREGTDAGYAVSPAMTNPTIWNQLAEGFAGKLSTAQGASVRNQAVTNRLVRQALNLPEDVPITRDALRGIRQQAGQEYEALRAAGPMQADPAYQIALQNITARYRGAARDFPDLANDEVAQIVHSINRPGFDSGSAIDALRVLREAADDAFRQGHGGIGSAIRQAAGALEDLMERNLQQTGRGDLLQAMRAARQDIARSYSVEGALNDSTGNVVAGKLAAQLKRGKPLTDDLRTVARFSQAFPKQTAEVTSSMPGVSPLDYAVGGSTAAATGNPALLGATVARPAMRSVILSRPYQRMMTAPNYGQNFLYRGTVNALQQPITMNALSRITSANAQQE